MPCYAVYDHFPVETPQKGPQCCCCCCLSVRKAGFPVWLSLSFSDSTGRWKMVSINSSEQHGWLCREESWGRGNGSVQRSAAHDYGSLLQLFPLTAVADAAVPQWTGWPTVHGYRRRVFLVDHRGNQLFGGSVRGASFPTSLYAPQSPPCIGPPWHSKSTAC